jgi:hypothetical protein
VADESSFPEERSESRGREMDEGGKLKEKADVGDLPDVPTKEPSDDGPAAKKPKQSHDRMPGE